MAVQQHHAGIFFIDAVNIGNAAAGIRSIVIIKKRIVFVNIPQAEITVRKFTGFYRKICRRKFCQVWLNSYGKRRLGCYLKVVLLLPNGLVGC